MTEEKAPATAAGLKSFGALVVEQGLVTEEELERAVGIQRGKSRKGNFVRLGEILIAEGLLEGAQVRAILEQQELSILVCERCLTQYNIERFSQDRLYRCERCQTPLVSPTKLVDLKVEDTLRSASGRFSKRGKESTKSARFAGYEILGEISRGGMSIVYKAHQTSLDRIVAVKVLLSLGEATDTEISQFIREARAVSKLRHPNIVAVHDVGEEDSVNFFTMEYIEGTTLDRAVLLECLGHREIATIFAKIADAVAFSQSRGVIHRDLKPTNVLIDRALQPTVIDFGIAKSKQDRERPGDQLVGSPAYLAPEYVSGKAEYDERCEVYALGTSLYQCLSGRTPHDDVSTRRILENITRRAPPDIRRIAPSVPPALCRIVMTAIQTDRGKRYRDVAALRDDLERFLRGEEIDGGSTAGLRAWRKVRVKVAFGLMLALAVSLVFSSGYYSRRVVESGRSLEAYEALYFRSQLQLARSLFRSGKLEDAQAAILELLQHEKPPSKEALRLQQEIQAARLRQGKG